MCDSVPPPRRACEHGKAGSSIGLFEGMSTSAVFIFLHSCGWPCLEGEGRNFLWPAGGEHFHVGRKVPVWWQERCNMQDTCTRTHTCVPCERGRMVVSGRASSSEWQRARVTHTPAASVTWHPPSREGVLRRFLDPLLPPPQPWVLYPGLLVVCEVIFFPCLCQRWCFGCEVLFSYVALVRRGHSANVVW